MWEPRAYFYIGSRVDKLGDSIVGLATCEATCKLFLFPGCDKFNDFPQVCATVSRFAFGGGAGYSVTHSVYTAYSMYSWRVAHMTPPLSAVCPAGG